MTREAKAMVVSALSAENTVDGKKTIFKLAKIFVSNALHLLITLIGRVNRRKVSLQNRNEFLRGFFGLRELHGVWSGLI